MRAVLKRSYQSLAPLRQHRLMRTLWTGLAYSLIALAVALTSLRLAMPWLERQVEPWAQEHLSALGFEFEVQRITLDLQGLQLRAQADRVRLRPSTAEGVPIELPRVYVGIDLVESLLQRQLITSVLEFEELELALQIDEKGVPHLRGLPEGDAGQGHQLLRWLARQPEIRLQGAILDITDSKARSWPLNDVYLSLRSAGYRHQLSGQFSPPFGFGQRIEIAGDWYGRLTRPQSWDGRFWLGGSELQIPVLQESLAPWLSGFSKDLDKPTQGNAEFALWTTWSEGMFEQAQLQLQLQDVVLPPLAGVSAWAAPRVQLDAWAKQTAADHWAFGVTPLRITSEQGVLDPILAQATLQLTRSNNRVDWTQSAFGVQLREIRLSDAPNWPPHWQSLLPEQAHAWWKNADIHGQLSELQFEYHPEAKADETRLSGTLEFHDLGFRAEDRWPGIRGLSASVRVEDTQAQLQLHSQNLALNWPQHWHAPIELGAVEGEWFIQREDDGAIRASSDRIHAKTAAWFAEAKTAIHLPAGSSKPILDLESSFSVEDLAAVAAYLPYSRVPPTTLNWLQTGLVAGHARAGQMRLHGDLQHFPFEYGGGEFDIAMQIENATLSFDPLWQPLKRVQGPMHFHNAALEFMLTEGYLGDADLAGAHMKIDRLNPRGHLEVIGKTQTSMASAQALLRGTAQDIPFLTEELRGEGVLDLELNLRKQLDGTALHSSGVIQTQGLNLTLPNYRDLPVQDLRGTLRFADGELEGEGLEAEVLGGSLKLAAHADVERGGSRLYLAGNTPMAGIQTWLPLHLLQKAEGQFNWSAEVPLKAGGATPENPVVVQSGMVDVGLSLPMPLRKPVGEAWPLRFTWARAADATQVELELTEHVIANVRLLDPDLGESSGDLRWRGGIHFGPGAPLQSEKGLRVSGKLPNLSVTAWQDLWSQETTSGTDSDFSLGHLPFDQIEALHLSADTLEIFGQLLRDVDLGANRDIAQWNGTLISDRIAGGFHVPMNADAPYRLNLDRAHIRTQSGIYRPDAQGELQVVTEREPTDPRKVPSLQVSCRDLKVDDLNLGQLDLTAYHSELGLLVQELTLTQPESVLKGVGAWLNWEGETFSRFAMDVDSKSLQALVSPFGYQGGIDRAAVKVRSNTQWLGSPADFDWTGMVGDMRMEIGKGRLLDVEPGAGRVFGLLGVHTLPRRLTLDFTDLFKKGLGFDRIVGDFEFKGGHAITDNLILESPSADIRFQGRIGLAERDYDQIVTVNPKVSESLPVAGAIAGGPAGAAVGGVLMLLQKITEKEGKGIATTQYRMTGSWDDPQMEKLAAVTAPSPAAVPQVENENQPAERP
ncbi:MAG: YhdP family protein [Gammaproteobacteria bacterium]